MDRLKVIVIVAALTVIFGVAGRMDYEEEVYNSIPYEQKEEIHAMLGDKSTISDVVSEYERIKKIQK